MACIILADDDAATRDLVSRALLSDGHEVQIAADGLEALDVLRARTTGIDLLVSDIEMPGLDGLALLKAARELSPGLKVLLMSGFESSIDRAADIDGVGVRCIGKPFTLEKIRAEVRAVLG